MTMPDLSALVPTKYKALVALLSAAATFTLPLLAGTLAGASPTVQAIVALVVALLGAAAVHQTPYLPKGSVIARPVPPVEFPSVPVELPVDGPMESVIKDVINAPVPELPIIGTAWYPGKYLGKFINPWLK